MFKKLKPKARVVMLSTCANGGMGTVVNAYEKDGFFDSQNVHLICTHSDGNVFVVLWYFLRSLLSFLYQLIFKNVTLIHIHSASRGSFWRKSLYAVIGFIFKTPVIFHIHGASIEKFYSSLPRVFKKYFQWVVEHSKCVIVLSESWKSYISSVAPNSTIEVVNNYVVLPEIGKKKVNNKIKILFLGIVGKRKGIYDIINSINYIAEKNPNFEFIIGGNGEVEVARKKVKENKVDKFIKFLGWVNLEQKNELLRDADVYVLPSYNEGLPMSLLEAMSWGLPVISTDVGGIPELIRNGEDGFIIKPGDVDALSKKLLALIDSEDLRVQMGVNGRSRIKNNFSDLSVLPKLELIYSKLKLQE
jgi:glycosyltransferase involved in cell wall biosynthesis